jgi:phage anti-repressor protein
MIYIIIPTMDTSFNIVNFMEESSITLLSSEYNNKFIQKIQETFTEEQQQLFISSLYCYLNYDQETDFVIDLDNIWKWLGFSQKAMAKRLLETNFILDKDYKVLLCRSAEQTTEGRGGHNKQTVLLNVQTFKLFCLKAGTDRAGEIHKYFVKMELLLQQTITEETNNLRQQLEQAKEELKLVQVSSKVPTVYIYNTDVNITTTPVLKIGITNCLNERIQPYRTISPFGKVIFYETINDTNINIKDVERTIHSILRQFNVKQELFKVDIDTAIKCLRQVTTSYIVYNNHDEAERTHLINKLDNTNVTLFEDDVETPPTNTCDASTQTEMNELDPITTPIIQGNPEVIEKFNKFIEDYCIVHPDAQVSAKDIVGQHRLHVQEAKKETTQAFTDYLKRRFVYDRLQNNEKDQVVNGFTGVKLKEITYNYMSTPPSEIETFVFERCVFTPGGTALTKSILEEYRDWRRILKKTPPLGKEEDELIRYLKQSPYTLYDTVWTTSGNGAGFYGLKLKIEIKHHRKTSSTGCTIVKKNQDGQVLNEYNTIAKAAETEQMCGAKMSRAVRDRKIFGTEPNTYYFEKKYL